MSKSIIKEIGIMILLLAVIILLLVVVLYDYNPNQKTIPSKLEKYKLSASVEEELDKTVEIKTQNIIKTYTIDEQDLASYEKNDEYDRGKINPFRTSPAENIPNTNNTSGIINIIGK